jgi:hypothetical protein
MVNSMWPVWRRPPRFEFSRLQKSSNTLPGLHTAPTHMNFTSSISDVLDDVDPSNTTSIQTAALNLVAQFQTTANEEKRMPSPILSDLLGTPVGHCVLQALVQSHYRLIPASAMDRYGNDLLSLLLDAKTSPETIASACPQLLQLIRHPSNTLITPDTVERVQLYYDKHMEGFTVETVSGIPPGIHTALQITHVISQKYEFALGDDAWVPPTVQRLIHCLVKPMIKQIALPVMRNVRVILQSTNTASIALAHLCLEIFFRATRAFPQSAPELWSEIIKAMPKCMNCILEGSRTSTWDATTTTSVWELYNRMLTMLNDVENKNPQLLKRQAREVLNILVASVRLSSNTAWCLPDKTVALSFDNMGNLCADYNILWLNDVRPKLELLLRTSIFPRLALSKTDKDLWENNPLM